MRILAIDPGTRESGWVLLDTDTGAVLRHGKDANERLLSWYDADMVDDEETLEPRDQVVIEAMSPRGMRLGEESMDTLFWTGRLYQALVSQGHVPFLVSRNEVKRVLLGRTNDSDSAVNAVLWDRYGGTGGRKAAKGVKRAPGPLYGVTLDSLAALGVACAFVDGARDLDTERRERAEGKAAKATAA